MNNSRVREALRSNRVYSYELAKAIGVSEATMCRRLRNEMPESEQERLVAKIEEMVKHG